MRKQRPALLFTALAVVVACSDVSSDPPIDCDSLTGQHFIVMQPPATGSIYDYTFNVGDSIRLIGTVHRVNGATATFDQLGGWSCAITGSSPVPGVVTFTTNDTQRITIGADNWCPRARLRQCDRHSDIRHALGDVRYRHPCHIALKTRDDRRLIED